MLASLNQQKQGTLPSNILKNPKNEGHYLTIATQSGKETVDPHMIVVDEPRNNSIDVDKTPESEIEKSTGVGKSIEKNMEMGKVFKTVLKTIP